MRKTGFTAVLLLALPLSGCGLSEVPRVAALNVSDVRLPSTISAVAPMQVDVRVDMGCALTSHRLTLVSRTAQTLTLKAEANSIDPGAVCPPVYIESTLSYTDPGAPARTNPFEVIVNGKSWGKVNVQ